MKSYLLSWTKAPNRESTLKGPMVLNKLIFFTRVDPLKSSPLKYIETAFYQHN